MQAVAPAPPRHQPAGELVDDDDLPFLDDVVDVALEQDVRAQRLLHGMVQLHLRRVVQVLDAQQGLRLLDPLLGERHGARLLVDGVVLLLLQTRDDGVGARIDLGRLLGRPGDDERRPRLVDQDRVDLVHDAVVVAALDHRVERVLHVVAQIVEPELVVGSVGDVGGVGLLAGGVVHVVLDDADAQAQEPVDRAHPGGVAPCQVIVHGDDVDALPGQGIEIGGQGRDQRLSLAGLHLGDLPLVQDHAADELHVEVPHADGPPACLPAQREGLRQHVVQRDAALQALLQLDRLGPYLLVGEGRDPGLNLVDGRDPRLELPELALVLGADDFPEDGVDQHRV